MWTLAYVQETNSVIAYYLQMFTGEIKATLILIWCNGVSPEVKLKFKKQDLRSASEHFWLMIAK